MAYRKPYDCGTPHWLDYVTIEGRSAVACRYCDYYHYID